MNCCKCDPGSNLPTTSSRILLSLLPSGLDRNYSTFAAWPYTGRPVIVNESTSMQSPPVASNNSKLQTNVKTPPQVHSRRPEMRAYSHACVHRGTWIRSVMRSSAASRWAWTRRRPGIPIDGAVDRSCTSPTYTYSTSVRALWVQAGRAHASTQLLAPNPHLDMDV